MKTDQEKHDRDFQGAGKLPSCIAEGAAGEPAARTELVEQNPALARYAKSASKTMMTYVTTNNTATRVVAGVGVPVAPSSPGGGSSSSGGGVPATSRRHPFSLGPRHDRSR